MRPLRAVLAGLWLCAAPAAWAAVSPGSDAPSPGASLGCGSRAARGALSGAAVLGGLALGLLPRAQLRRRDHD